MACLQSSIAVFCLSLTVGTPAYAQIQGGLFGATRSDAGSREKLNIQAAISQALDSEVPLEFQSLVPRNELQAGGHSSAVTASANYARERRNVQLFLNGSTYFRYAQRLDGIRAGSQSGEIGVGVRLPRQGSFRITQAAAYSPSYLYQLFPASPLAPGEAIPVNPEYQIVGTESYSHSTITDVAFGSARGTRLTATADYRRNDFEKELITRPRVETYGTGAKVSRALSRVSALSAGYDFNIGEFGFGGRSKEHRVTLGVEYSPALTVRRRATLRLEISPSAAQISESMPAIDNPRSLGRVYPLQGEASISYPLRLKWHASANYRRSFDHVPVLTEPVLTSGARATLTGVIGRRVDVSALAGYAIAESADLTSARNLTTYTGEARIRYALSRSVAFYSEYLYYYVDLREQALLLRGIPGRFEQHGIRAGFMFFGQPLRK